MSENAVVRARIDERVKEEAAAVLAAMGLTVSDAFRMMMIRIAREKALPSPITRRANGLMESVGNQPSTSAASHEETCAVTARGTISPSPLRNVFDTVSTGPRTSVFDCISLSGVKRRTAALRYLRP